MNCFTFFYECMWEAPCSYAHCLCSWCLQKAGKGIGSPGVGVAGSYEMLCGCWELTELRSYTRAASALNPWALSPAPNIVVLYKKIVGRREERKETDCGSPVQLWEPMVDGFGSSQEKEVAVFKIRLYGGFSYRLDPNLACTLSAYTLPCVFSLPSSTHLSRTPLPPSAFGPHIVLGISLGASSSRLGILNPSLS